MIYSPTTISTCVFIIRRQPVSLTTNMKGRHLSVTALALSIRSCSFAKFHRTIFNFTQTLDEELENDRQPPSLLGPGMMNRDGGPPFGGPGGPGGPDGPFNNMGGGPPPFDGPGGPGGPPGGFNDGPNGGGFNDGPPFGGPGGFGGPDGGPFMDSPFRGRGGPRGGWRGRGGPPMRGGRGGFGGPGGPGNDLKEKRVGNGEEDINAYFSFSRRLERRTTRALWRRTTGRRKL